MSETRPIVLVTGATGFIGRHLVAHLVSQGVTVRAVLRPDSPRSAPPGTTMVRAPLDAEALLPALTDVDAVVHLAGTVASPRVAAYGDVNVKGTRAVADAARRAGVRLVHISSQAAAGPAPAASPRSESDPPLPLTPYGRSKLEGERVVADTEGLHWTILRPAAVYGPGDRAMLPLFQLVSRRVIPVVGRRDASFTFVHVRDVITAIAAALAQHLPGETFFVGHPRPVAARELVHLLARVVGNQPMQIAVPAPLAWTAAHLCEFIGRTTGRSLPLNASRYAEMCAEGFVCRVDRLRERLGVEATVPLEEGLAETLAWYRLQGWVKAAR
jgi:nucleoside-diphosphate-sugar epimerase